MSNRLLCLLLSASLFAAGAVEAAGNTTIESFNKAKKILEHQVYQDHRITFTASHLSIGTRTLRCPKAS